MLHPDASQRPVAPALSARHRIGRAVAWGLAAYVFAQAARAMTDPLGFAAAFGLPTEAPDFVRVYAVRAVFIGVCTSALLVQRRLVAVSTLALAAIVMPLGDLALVVGAGAPTATVARHVVIAGVLLATGLLLWPEDEAPST